MSCTVYVDQFLLGNMVMNYAILWSAAKLCRVKVTMIRKAAGAGLGAVYSLSVLLPGCSFFMSTFAKFLASLLIVMLACYPQPPRTFLAFFACFYLSSFALGGMVFGSIFFLNTNPFFSGEAVAAAIDRYFWPGLLAGLPAFYFAGRALPYVRQGLLLERLYKIPVIVRFAGAEARLAALVDTGNSLVDPLSGCPVIVAEYAAVQELLPPETRFAFAGDGGPDIWNVLASTGSGPFAGRFLPVSFHSIGRTGMLVGFRPDEVLLELEGRLTSIRKVVVALYGGRLDEEGKYSALLPPGLLGGEP
ncbi:MAG: sigma-E processing peptidase SpoIIGA [Firmicutes bacterium]|nr:sigma-E processing peptidase SpoIIGA [Bacillota bacterium]